MMIFNCAKDASIARFKKIVASSFLTEGKKQYSPENIMDSSTNPWCVKGTDKNPSIRIEYDEKVKFKNINILNGYAKGDLFKKIVV